MPAYNGYLQDRYDAVSHQVIHFGNRNFSGHVSVTNGSTSVTWVDGDTFHPESWINAFCTGGYCQMYITGTSGGYYNIDHAVDSTHLVLASAYTGTAGTTSQGWSAHASGIYSNSIHWYNSATQTWTAGPSAATFKSDCAADSATLPGDRHPVGQWWVDTIRHRAYVASGINTNCPSEGNGPSPRADQYYLSLNNNVALDTWTQQMAPGSAGALPYTAATGTCVFDPDDDVTVCLGDYNENIFVQNFWIYGETGSSIPAKQTAAGLTTPGGWNMISGITVNGAAPSGIRYASMVYDSINKRIVFFGGANGSGTCFNGTAVYNVPTKTWTAKSSSTAPAAQNNSTFNCQYPIAFDSANGLVYIHAVNPTLGDWTYNAASDTWTSLGNLGGPAFTQTMTYDPSTNKLIAFAQCQSVCTGSMETWEAQLPGPCAITSSSLPNGVAHSSYSQALAQSGCNASSWGISSGSLPGGLNLNASSGIISGTPLYAATYNFTVAYATATQNLTITVTAPPGVSLSVPLNIQEALYSGVAGVARTNEPFSMGIPIADSSGVAHTNAMGLTGAVPGSCQFRVLGWWPSGNIKWVEVYGLLPSLSAGAVSNAVSLTNGSGGYGNCGPGMASDNGATISVATGTATFTVRKAHFDGLDAVSVGATNIVLTTGTTYGTRGLVVTGPNPTATFPGNVTCSPDTGGSSCNVLYWSDQDPNSNCSIEQDGPAVSVLACYGTLFDNVSHPYMQYTARLYFFSGQSYVKADVALRNADYNTATDIGGGVFDTAYKGLKSWEWRTGLNLSGTLNYTVANHTATPSTGTMTGADDLYLYQGQSTWMNAVGTGNCAAATCANLYTSDAGYKIAKNGANQQTGTNAQCPQGWADIANSSGAGVEIGMYQLCAYYPSGLEFDQGGTDARIEMFSPQNSKAVYQPWPNWTVRTVYLNFHATAPVSPANSFLALQHYLLARPSISYVDSTGVFPYPHPTQALEDAYYQSLYPLNPAAGSLSNYCASGATPCTPDANPGSSSPALNCAVYYAWYWPDSGPGNQNDYRWGNLQKFLQQGQTCRWLDAAHWYRFLIEKGFPHWDGVSSTDHSVNSNQWTTRPHAGQGGAELDALGQPNGTRTNAALGDTCYGSVCWDRDWEHQWFDPGDYYFLSGDETFREGIIPIKSWYLNTDTYQGGCCIGNAAQYTRSVGEYIGLGSRFSQFLAAVNPSDTDAAAILNNATTVFNNFVKPDVCVRAASGGPWPAGCTPPPINTNGSNNASGVSRVRGVPYQNGMESNVWCNLGAAYPQGLRIQSYFQPAILVEGLDFLRAAKGPSWTDYELAGDLEYGISEWAIAEMFRDDGSTSWCPGCSSVSLSTPRFYNGFSYGEVLDMANVCPSNTAGSETLYQLPGPPGNNNYWDLEYGILGSAVLGQNTMPYFWTIYNTTGSAAWARQLKIQNQIVGLGQSIWPADFGQYQMQNIISILSNPTSLRLQNIPFSVQNNGGGSYTLTFTPPVGTTNLRIKWSQLQIKDISADDPKAGLLGFDNLANFNFSNSPAVYQPWFAANTTSEPAPTPGSQQSFTITGTGSSSLTAANFSVKGMSPQIIGYLGATSGAVVSSGAVALR